MNTISKLIKQFKKTWCVVDLAELGGGYVGQKFELETMSASTWYFMITPIELSSSGLADTVYPHLVLKRFRSENKASQWARKCIYGGLFHNLIHKKPLLPGKLYAVCKILAGTDGELDSVQIEKISYTQVGCDPIDTLYSVLSLEKEIPHNVWDSESVANRYKETLEYSESVVVVQM